MQQLIDMGLIGKKSTWEVNNCQQAWHLSWVRWFGVRASSRWCKLMRLPEASCFRGLLPQYCD